MLISICKYCENCESRKLNKKYKPYQYCKLHNQRCIEVNKCENGFKNISKKLWNDGICPKCNTAFSFKNSIPHSYFKLIYKYECENGHIIVLTRLPEKEDIK